MIGGFLHRKRQTAHAPDCSAAAATHRAERKLVNDVDSSATQKREAAMDKDRVKGAVREAKGAVKEKVGQVTGDAKTEAEGKTEKAAGKVQNAVGGVKDALRGDK
jgi:uncharacterized protein YjbJ (UPF0337 family)